MDGQEAAAVGHVAAALSALAVGALVLLRRKGTRVHRRVGSAYVVALLVVDAAALSLRRESTFGVFHALAVVSLVTLLVGVGPLVLGKRSPRVVTMHAYCMTWSYVGLVAAGAGQLVAVHGDRFGAWSVPAVIAAVLVGGGAWIFAAVPSVLRRHLR